MFNPYFLMGIFYLVVALLMALDVSLINFKLLAWFNGVVWLRVHFITLGIVTQVLFGSLPSLVAARRKLPQPATRWDIWLALNLGILILWLGIPPIKQPLILSGGTLVLIAALLLVQQLWSLCRVEEQEIGQSAKFYLSGLLYLFVGILVGTGVWLGWSGPLHIHSPIEVHIHANNWGFLSLVFAGLLIEIVPLLSGQALVRPPVGTLIFWSMTLGALGLVLGPWLHSIAWVIVPGLLLHIVATVSLVVLLIRNLARTSALRTAGAWHLITAYLWILLPVSVAPLILLKVPGFASGEIEATAPQALIYGWVLQLGFALIPFLLQRHLLGENKAGLGGNWWSLITINAGSAVVWASIFIVPQRSNLQGVAYGFYLIAMLPVVWQVGRMLYAYYKPNTSSSLILKSS